LPAFTARRWETGYYYHELSLDGQKAVAAFPELADGARGLEPALEPYLADVGERARILLYTQGEQGEAAAVKYLRECLASESARDVRSAALRTLSELGTARMARFVSEELAQSTQPSERRRLLDALAQFPPDAGAADLEKALLSDQIDLRARLAVIHHMDYDAYQARGELLARVAGAREVEMGGVIQLAHIRFGSKGDFEAVRALRSRLQEGVGKAAMGDYDYRAGVSAEEFNIQLKTACTLALCCESLDGCLRGARALDFAFSVERTNPGWRHFRGCEAIVAGLRKALDDPRAARWLYNQARQLPEPKQASDVWTVLLKTGGRHVVDALLGDVKQLAAQPDALRLLRYATEEQVRKPKNRQALLDLIGPTASASASSRFFAALALARNGDQAGIDLIDSDLRKAEQARKDGKEFALTPGTRFLPLLLEEIEYQPAAYATLRPVVARLPFPTLQVRAALGDLSSADDVTPALDWEKDKQMLAVLPRVESEVLYQALKERARSDNRDAREKAIRWLAPLRGRQKVEILAEMAMDGRNSTGLINGLTLAELALAALKTDGLATDSLLALVRVAQSVNPDVRRAALNQAAGFLGLMGQVQEETERAGRDLIKSPDEEARAVAVVLLAPKAGAENVKWLRERLVDPSCLVKRLAAAGLAHLLGRESIPLLENPSWAVRSGAAEGLGADATPALLEELHAFERDRKGVVSRPVWLIEEALRKRKPPLTPPVVEVQFRELAGP
jgi:hypothetical protein